MRALLGASWVVVAVVDVAIVDVAVTVAKPDNATPSRLLRREFMTVLSFSPIGSLSLGEV